MHFFSHQMLVINIFYPVLMGRDGEVRFANGTQLCDKSHQQSEGAFDIYCKLIFLTIQNAETDSHSNLKLRDILNAQIYYVGHSMGTTTYMAMNSMDPTWADKV